VVREDSLILVVGHSGAGEIALLHAHSHAPVLHVPHHLELLGSDIGPHLAEEFLLLRLFQAGLLLHQCQRLIIDGGY
jgi:hypothetical protein